MTTNLLLPIRHYDADMGLDYTLDGGPGNWSITVGDRIPVPLTDENAEAFIEHANRLDKYADDDE